MLTKSLTIASMLIAGAAAPASGAITTFELNDSGAGALFTSGQTFTATSASPAQFTVGTGGDALTLLVEATSSVSGLTGNTITEGGGGGGSGFGIDVNGPNSAQNGSRIESANGLNALGEGVLFSFKDSLGVDVAVNFISAELVELGVGETALVTIGTYTESATGDTTFGGTNRLLAAGGQASFFAGSETTFRFRSLTVEAVPEPASLLIIGTGLALMAGRRRRA